MKTLVVYLSIALLAAARVGGEEIGAYTDMPYRHALTVTKTANTNGLIVWTNTVKYPITLRSVHFNGGAGHTSSVGVSFFRLYDYDHQVRATEVVTNEFGEIQTNVFNQVTNITAYATSNLLASTTATNTSTIISINQLEATLRIPEDLYTKQGDVWYFWGRASKPVTFSFTE